MHEKTTRDETAQARRRLLINTAAKCFAEKGFHQTSMRDLAKRAGVSLGNVYNHFDSKTALILEIAKLEAEGLQAIQTELGGFDDPVQALDHFVKIYVKSCAERDYALLASEIMSEGLRNPEICADFLNNRKLLVETLAAIIGRIRSAMDSTGEIRPEDCAEFVLDLLEGAAARLAFERKTPGRARLARLRSGVHQLIGIYSAAG